MSEYPHISPLVVHVSERAMEQGRSLGSGIVDEFVVWSSRGVSSGVVDIPNTISFHQAVSMLTVRYIVT